MRLNVKVASVLSNVQRDVEEQQIKDMCAEIEVDQVEGNEAEDTEADKLPWYLITTNKLSMELWEVVISFANWYTLYTVPYLMVFPETISQTSVAFDLVIDALFLIDLCLNFVKVGPYVKDISLKSLSKTYLNSFFVIDFLSSVPPTILTIIGGSAERWSRYF